MNISILIWLYIHGLLILILISNLFFSFRRLWHLRTSPNYHDQYWLSKASRSAYFHHRTVRGTAITLAGELINIGLLWLGGVFG